MKEIYKNPIFYYILVPVLMALWPLVVWSVYLPETEDKWQTEKAQYNKAQKIMTEILNLDPDRLDFAESKANAEEFDYATVVDSITRSCKIPEENCIISSKPIRTKTSDNQKTQNATIIIKGVDLTKFAKFLSTIQLRWASLQCEKVKITKQKGLRDMWKVDLNFRYFY